MREQPETEISPARALRTLALLASLTLLIPAHLFGQAQIRMGSLDPSAAPTVTAPPATYPSYGNAAADGGAVASPSNITPFGPAPAASPAPTLPPGGYAAPPGGMIYTPGPAATLSGVQPPPNFDPFGPPGTVAPAPTAPQDPYYGNPQCPPPIFTLPPMIANYRALDVSLDYHWFAGKGDTTDQLGINDINVWATLALPIPWFSQPQPAAPQQQPQESLLLISPGFAWHYWAGPASTASDGFADMPARTYDAYLQVDWNPVIVPGALSAELEASYGIYSDFSTLTNQSYRFKGKGMAVIGIPDTKLQMKLGVWYIDRGLIKLLPAGGLVWTPSPYTEFDILFPNPRFRQVLYTTPGGTEWHWYLSGDYGGGVWTIKRSAFAPPSEVGHIDLVDYNDIRFALGVDFKRCAGQTGFFEVGYAFERQLVYASQMPDTFTPNGTFYLHAGASF
jgi:hypothetical protein